MFNLEIFPASFNNFRLLGPNFSIFNTFPCSLNFSVILLNASIEDWSQIQDSEQSKVIVFSVKFKGLRILLNLFIYPKNNVPFNLYLAMGVLLISEIIGIIEELV